MTSSNAAPSLEGFVKSALHRSWWLLLLRGIAAVAFGVLTFVWPQISLLTLIMVYGIYALADGILALIAAIRGGLLSRSEAISSFGYDAEDIDREIAADNARADALGLRFDSDPRYDHPAQAAATPASQAN